MTVPEDSIISNHETPGRLKKAEDSTSSSIRPAAWRVKRLPVISRDLPFRPRVRKMHTVGVHLGFKPGSLNRKKPIARLGRSYGEEPIIYDRIRPPDQRRQRHQLAHPHPTAGSKTTSAVPSKS